MLTHCEKMQSSTLTLMLPSLVINSGPTDRHSSHTPGTASSTASTTHTTTTRPSRKSGKCKAPPSATSLQTATRRPSSLLQVPRRWTLVLQPQKPHTTTPWRAAATRRSIGWRSTSIRASCTTHCTPNSWFSSSSSSPKNPSSRYASQTTRPTCKWRARNCSTRPKRLAETTTSRSSSRSSRASVG